MQTKLFLAGLFQNYSTYVPMRLVFDDAAPAAPGVPDVKADAPPPTKEAAPVVKEAPKPTVAEQLAALKETINTATDNVKKIAEAIGEPEADVKQAILHYDLSKHAKPLSSPHQLIIDKITRAITDKTLPMKDIMFYGGTDGNSFILRKVLAKGEKWHTENIQAYDQLIALGDRLYPKKARDLRDNYISEIQFYMSRPTLAARRQVVKDHAGAFLPGGGLFDLALALKRAKHAQKTLSNGKNEFDVSEQEVYLDLRGIDDLGVDHRKSGIWAIGEVKEEPVVEPPKPVEPKKEEPPEVKKEEPVVEPPKKNEEPPVKPPEPKKEDPPKEEKKEPPPPPPEVEKPPEPVKEKVPETDEFQLRRFKELAMQRPGEHIPTFIDGSVLITDYNIDLRVNPYIIFDKEKGTFTFGFDDEAHKDIVFVEKTPQVEVAGTKTDKWGVGNWEMNDRVPSVEEKQFKAVLKKLALEKNPKADFSKIPLKTKPFPAETVDGGATLDADEKKPEIAGVIALMELPSRKEYAKQYPDVRTPVIVKGVIFPPSVAPYVFYRAGDGLYTYGFDDKVAPVEYREKAAGDASAERAFKVELAKRVLKMQKDEEVAKAAARAARLAATAPKAAAAVPVAPAVKPADAAASAIDATAEHARLEAEYEKLAQVLTDLGVDADDVDLSDIQRRAKTNPGAAATVVLRGDLAAKMPLTMKAFVTYNEKDGTFEYRFDDAKKALPDFTNAGKSDEEKKSDLAGGKFGVELAKRIAGKKVPSPLDFRLP